MKKKYQKRNEKKSRNKISSAGKLIRGKCKIPGKNDNKGKAKGRKKFASGQLGKNLKGDMQIICYHLNEKDEKEFKF